MAQGRRVLLAGASGLVGGLLLRRLLDQRGIAAVAATVRRPLDLAHPRLVECRSDFAGAAAEGEVAATLRAADALPLDAFVSCLGTTLRAAGSRAAFVAVDRDLVLRQAAFAQGLGARHAVLVSSVGASRQSGNFYLRVKGEVEDALEGMGFARVDLVQPGLLIGPRMQRRPGEALAQRVAPAADWLLQGRLRRYRSLPADNVAAAIATLLGESAPGVHAHEHDALRAFAARAAG